MRLSPHLNVIMNGRQKSEKNTRANIEKNARD